MNDHHQLITLSFVVPCFNEELVLPATATRLQALLISLKERKLIGRESGIVFIDDGSKDSTWKIICDLSSQHSEFSGIKLSRNIGHQRALLAGLMNTTGDALISIDADLQDDLGVIDDMISLHLQGN